MDDTKKIIIIVISCIAYIGTYILCIINLIEYPEIYSIVSAFMMFWIGISIDKLKGEGVDING